jgi:2-polyprenyl-3-methyl-5-hydroxy-6-metoxy-1,4-benzoquinol methylase
MKPTGVTSYPGTLVLEVMPEAKKYNDYLNSLIERYLRPGAQVLDFGAGTGTFAIRLLRRGVEVICVEPDAVLCAQLRDAGATIAELEHIADQSLDLIYTLNVLEHIADDAATVHSLATKLKLGGTLFIYVPAFRILYSLFDARIGHLRRYRRATLAKLVIAAGLQIVEARYVDSIGFVVALLFRALRREKISPTTVKIYDSICFPLSLIVDKLISCCLGKNVMVVGKK